MSNPDPLERTLKELSEGAESILRSITPASLDLIAEIPSLPTSMRHSLALGLLKRAEVENDGSSEEWDGSQEDGRGYPGARGA